ncbi:putative Zn finger-like uncharacterized protein [Rhizomicrobium palustre]|uniref:Putative Zn finger-like uncharacterized protein n=1 Tax=Rhizomicrobium palustre TaxID=189966 RepID=A0A846MWZ2_9PROT|nr:DUF3426 domain-containing protein [Rhizomicrobium palustre]NIK87926.1 putative Zn finger-like uncharacterized protein [Rhizomicrobium palustre]
MILTCPACTTRYEVDAAKFPAAGRNVRCVKCSHVWHAMPESEEDPDSIFAAPEPVARQPEPEPTPRGPQIRTPEIRDPEPQDDDAAGHDQASAAPKAEPWYTKKTFVTAGWGALGVFVLLIGIVGVGFRHTVVDLWPKSASLYSHLGLKAAQAGLKLAETRTREAAQNGQVVLTVSGAVTNVTDRELPVPQIRVGLVDRDKRELYHWTVAPHVLVLKPGQSTQFETRLSNPPQGASNYEIRFAKAGE